MEGRDAKSLVMCEECNIAADSLDNLDK